MGRTQLKSYMNLSTHIGENKIHGQKRIQNHIKKRFRKHIRKRIHRCDWKRAVGIKNRLPRKA